MIQKCFCRQEFRGRGRRCNDGAISDPKSICGRGMQVLCKDIMPQVVSRLEDILSRFAAMSVKPVKVRKPRADSGSPVSQLSSPESGKRVNTELRKRRAKASPADKCDDFPASKQRRLVQTNDENIPPILDQNSSINNTNNKNTIKGGSSLESGPVQKKRKRAIQ